MRMKKGLSGNSKKQNEMVSVVKNQDTLAGLKHFVSKIVTRKTIYSAFPFYNELDLLDFRLQVLSPVVDYFVVVEATHTFTGKSKPLYYQENKHRFRRYANKIIHVCVDELPAGGNPWDMDYFQRNAIMRGLTKAKPDDIILLSDCDEIANPSTVLKLYNMDLSKPLSIPLCMCYYYMNCLNVTAPYWYRCKAVAYQTLLSSTPQEMRMFELSAENLKESDSLYPGWHLSYLNGVKGIQDKMNAFAHQEYNTEEYVGAEHLQDCIANGKDFIGRPYEYWVIDPITFLPRWVNRHCQRNISDFRLLSAATQREHSSKFQEIIATPYSQAFGKYEMS
ncbi:MAG: hypothetical protein LBM69_06385 [Lachnospiraceae bacterium]|nr:hypothetical protein [Lachnospiraceae bacterium]